MSDGWIKIHRTLLEWEWYDDQNTFRVFIHLLLTANHKPNKWHGIAVGVGQKITSYAKLSEELGLSIQSVRSALENLRSTGEITSKSTNKYTVISINNYEAYQQTNKQTNKQVTNKQQTKIPDTRLVENNKQTNKQNDLETTNFQQASQQASNKQATTNKNEKNIINIISLTRNQKEKLKLMFPNKNVDEELLKANDYLRSTGAIKNDYLAWFRNWLRKENYQKQGGNHVRRISIAPIPE